MQALYFDMDGTIADLYNVPDWLPKLQAEDVSPYVEAQTIIDPQTLNSLLLEFVALGITIGVISWSAMNGAQEYNKEVRQAKLDWVRANIPAVSEFHVVKYGTPKHYVRKIKDSILIDDNSDVRDKWQGATIDATNPKDMLKSLQKLLDILKQADVLKE